MASPPPPNDEIFVDLHGVTVAEAAERLRDEITAAFQRKTKRIVFVHGQGNHSGGDAPLARKVREWLKALLDTPRGALKRIEFGEDTEELGHNAGCVRVSLALQLARNDVFFTPAASGKQVKRVADRKRDARKSAGRGIEGAIDKALERADDELRKRFGEPGADGPYRPPSLKRGEWPGQR